MTFSEYVIEKQGEDFYWESLYDAVKQMETLEERLEDLYLSYLEETQLKTYILTYKSSTNTTFHLLSAKSESDAIQEKIKLLKSGEFSCDEDYIKNNCKAEDITNCWIIGKLVGGYITKKIKH